MLLHAEHFPPPALTPLPHPLSAASGASSTAEGTKACPRPRISSPHQTPTIPASASFCSHHPPVEEFPVRLKAGSAACQSLISGPFNFPPKKKRKKIRKKKEKHMLQKKIGACRRQRTFNFYLLCKEILHKRMGNNDYQCTTWNY